LTGDVHPLSVKAGVSIVLTGGGGPGGGGPGDGGRGVGGLGGGGDGNGGGGDGTGGNGGGGEGGSGGGGGEGGSGRVTCTGGGGGALGWMAPQLGNSVHKLGRSVENRISNFESVTILCTEMPSSKGFMLRLYGTYSEERPRVEPISGSLHVTV